MSCCELSKEGRTPNLIFIFILHPGFSWSAMVRWAAIMRAANPARQTAPTRWWPPFIRLSSERCRGKLPPSGQARQSARLTCSWAAKLSNGRRRSHLINNGPDRPFRRWRSAVPGTFRPGKRRILSRSKYPGATSWTFFTIWLFFFLHLISWVFKEINEKSKVFERAMVKRWRHRLYQKKVLNINPYDMTR